MGIYYVHPSIRPSIHASIHTDLHLHLHLHTYMCTGDAMGAAIAMRCKTILGWGLTESFRYLLTYLLTIPGFWDVREGGWVEWNGT